MILKIKLRYLALYFMPTSLLKRRKSASSISSATRSTSFSFSFITPALPDASLHRCHSASFSDVLALDRIDSGSGATFSSFFSSTSRLRPVFCTFDVSSDLRRCWDVTDGEGDPAAVVVVVVVVAPAAATAVTAPG